MDYQNFFNRDFFPTPVDVIDQMMQFSEVQGKIVLEPSAGSGNIVDWLRYEDDECNRARCCNEQRTDGKNGFFTIRQMPKI